MKKTGKWFVLAAAAVMQLVPAQGQAMELDWSGDFRVENHWVKNYSLSQSNTGTQGYSIVRGPSDPAQFQTLFMRLKPKAIVNDNITLRSELWFGSPSGGFFGDSGGGAAGASGRHLNTFDSTFSAGGVLSAQRFWMEVLTDVGNVQVGRAPLDWGLGIVWNAGDGLWSRYASTGDVIRMVSKFGAFSFLPAAVKYTYGDRIGGSTGVSDYALALKYENVDEGFDGGVNFIRRIGGAGNSVYTGTLGGSGGFNYTTWDLFTRKRMGRYEFGLEAPIITGNMGGSTYSTYALAGEGKATLGDSWQVSVKAGRVPGQPAGATDRYKAVYFNPNYRLGMILFGYGLQNLGTTNPEDAFYAPVTNANYLNLGGQYSSGKWQFRGSWLMASAAETAGVGGSFFNQWKRSNEASTATVAQESSYGWELDLGASMFWDDNLEFKADAGMFVPGGFYKYSATGTENQLGNVLALSFGVGARF